MNAREHSQIVHNFIRRIKRPVIVSGLLVVFISIPLGKVFFGLGIFVALSWSCINIYLLGHVLREILDRGSNRRLLPFYLFVKFPALYGLGYLILVCGYFPVESIVMGLTLFLVILFVIAISSVSVKK